MSDWREEIWEQNGLKNCGKALNTWKIGGDYHRLDGPAIMWLGGSRVRELIVAHSHLAISWCIAGEMMTQGEYFTEILRRKCGS